MKPQVPFLKVKDDVNYVRDTSTNAILAHNMRAKEEFEQIQKQKISESQKILNLEKSVSEIKDLLVKLINRMDSK